MKCLNCGKEVSSRAKYCSDACRKAYGRKSDTNPDKTEANPDTLPGQMVSEPGQTPKSDKEDVRAETHLLVRGNWILKKDVKAVLHPLGDNEVLLTSSTRQYFSLMDGYVAKRARDGFPECTCEHCVSTGLVKLRANLSKSVEKSVAK